MISVSGIKTAIFLGYKSIVRSNRWILVLTVGMVMLTYTNLLFTSGLFSGLFGTVKQQIIDTHYAHVIIEPEENKTYIEDVRELRSILESIPGVIRTAVRYRVGATFLYDEGNDGKDIRSESFAVYSMDPKEESGLTSVEGSIVEGEYLTAEDRDQIILGANVAGGYDTQLSDASLGGVQVGEELTLLFPNGISRTYTVKGIFYTKFDLVDQFAFLTKEEMDSILNEQDRASEIVAQIENPNLDEVYTQKLANLGYGHLRLRSVTDKADQIFGDVQQVITMIQTVISAVSIVVAGITIFIIIFINVTNKRRQIGILKAIGVREEIITRSYMIQSVFFSVIGIILGGCIVTFIIYPYTVQNPFEFPFGETSIKLIITNYLVYAALLLGIALLSGYVPARMTTRQTILEAIWGK
ncbi:MAG: ABC transporter permease [Patescibacteria group bacterium]